MLSHGHGSYLCYEYLKLNVSAGRPAGGSPGRARIAPHSRSRRPGAAPRARSKTPLDRRPSIRAAGSRRGTTPASRCAASTCTAWAAPAARGHTPPASSSGSPSRVCRRGRSLSAAPPSGQPRRRLPPPPQEQQQHAPTPSRAPCAPCAPQVRGREPAVRAHRQGHGPGGLCRAAAVPRGRQPGRLHRHHRCAAGPGHLCRWAGAGLLAGPQALAGHRHSSSLPLLRAPPGAALPGPPPGWLAPAASRPYPRPRPAGLVLLAPMLSLERVSKQGANRVLRPVADLLSHLLPRAAIVATDKNTMFPALQDCWDQGELAGRMGGWLAGWMDGWLDGWLGGWMHGWVAGRMAGWMGGWVIGWMDGWRAGGGPVGAAAGGAPAALPAAHAWAAA
jgi:hypothetical protein